MAGHKLPHKGRAIVTEDSVQIMDGAKELIYWDKAELKDVTTALEVCEAIRVVYEMGPEETRRRLELGKRGVGGV